MARSGDKRSRPFVSVVILTNLFETHRRGRPCHFSVAGGHLCLDSTILSACHAHPLDCQHHCSAAYLAGRRRPDHGGMYPPLEGPAPDHRLWQRGARQLCDYFKLDGIAHVTWPADHWKRFGRFIWWFVQTIKVTAAVHGANSRSRRAKNTSSSPAPNFSQPGNGMPAFRLEAALPAGAIGHGIARLLAPKWFSGKRGPGDHFHRLSAHTKTGFCTGSCARRKCCWSRARKTGNS